MCFRLHLQETVCAEKPPRRGLLFEFLSTKKVTYGDNRIVKSQYVWSFLSLSPFPVVVLVKKGVK